MKQAPRLTLCMIVKNEERNLQACLDSVRRLVDEIIVVDTGSTDSTPKIAADNGAAVFPYDFTRVDFAAARNYGIARASGKWILILDADETLESASAPLVEAIVCSAGNTGYYFARHYRQPKGEVLTDYAVRLFPNRLDYRYRGRVHETTDAAILAGGGQLSRSGINIQHNFPGREARRRRSQRYVEILKQELAENPDDISRLDFLAAEYHQLEMFTEAAAVAECIAQVRPLDPTAHLNAGIYHLVFTPDPERARADFRRALELNPDYPEAVSFLQSMDERECLARR